MAAPNVDIVFVIDASESMRPCFEQLRQHLSEVYAPMQGLVSKVRFGMVAQSVGSTGGVVMFDHQFLCGSGPDAMKKLYSKAPNDTDTQNEFLTDNSEKLKQSLSVLKPQGNEDMLVALDIALDFPFGSLSNTKRVVALFSDESFEGGISKSANNEKIPDLIQKIQNRHIQLFCAIPDSAAIQKIAEVDRSEIELVDGGGGLSTVNFRQLLGQMGKSISGSMLQSVSEPAYKRAIFGQDTWGESRALSATNRDVILSVGESANLDDSGPIKNIHVQLNWTRAIDLDLHAFFKNRRGQHRHLYFVNRHTPIDGVSLDNDAGVGDRGGQNVENINVSDIDAIEEILFAIKIFGDGERFCDYDARVVVDTGNGEKFIVPLTSSDSATWCVIAKISNHPGRSPKVVNVNCIMEEEPTVDSV